MIGIVTKNAPAYKTVVPYFAASSLSYVVFALLFWFTADELPLHYTQPGIVALTHTSTLLIISMMTMGTLHQFVPVVFKAKLYSEKLAYYNFYLFSLSSGYLITAFYTNSFLTHVPIAASLVSISLWLFIYNILMSYRGKKQNDIASVFILSALFWLFITTIYGLLQAFNFRYSYLNNSLDYLKFHVHTGLIGWLLLLVIGVSSILLPMFFISHRYTDKKLLKYSFYLINTGLISLWIYWQLIAVSYLLIIAWGLIITGTGFYLTYIYQSFKYKKKKLDIMMRHSALAFVFFIIPLIFSLILVFDLQNGSKYMLNSIYIYAFGIIIGFYTNLITGISYRTLPFIIWLVKYKKFLGKKKVPKPDDLYYNNIGKLQFYIYAVMLIVLFIALYSTNTILLKIAAFLLLSSATLFNVNVFIIICKSSEHLTKNKIL